MAANHSLDIFAANVVVTVSLPRITLRFLVIIWKQTSCAREPIGEWKVASQQAIQQKQDRLDSEQQDEAEGQLAHDVTIGDLQFAESSDLPADRFQACMQQPAIMLVDTGMDVHMLWTRRSHEPNSAAGSAQHTWRRIPGKPPLPTPISTVACCDGCSIAEAPGQAARGKVWGDGSLFSSTTGSFHRAARPVLVVAGLGAAFIHHIPGILHQEYGSPNHERH